MVPSGQNRTTELLVKPDLAQTRMTIAAAITSVTLTLPVADAWPLTADTESEQT